MNFYGAKMTEPIFAWVEVIDQAAILFDSSRRKRNVVFGSVDRRQSQSVTFEEIGEKRNSVNFLTTKKSLS